MVHEKNPAASASYVGNCGPCGLRAGWRRHVPVQHAHTAQLYEDLLRHERTCARSAGGAATITCARATPRDRARQRPHKHETDEEEASAPESHKHTHNTPDSAH